MYEYEYMAHYYSDEVAQCAQNAEGLTNEYVEIVKPGRQYQLGLTTCWSTSC